VFRWHGSLAGAAEAEGEPKTEAADSEEATGDGAAKSDEHITVMSRLAGVLENAELCERLGSTTDPLEIHRALTSEPEEPRTATLDAAPADVGRTGGSSRVTGTKNHSPWRR
jgi:hypothetical protein